ncbi:putative sucrose-phosphate synthase, partial [Cucurbita argyrosperma subsp. argyrosperma]
MAGNGWVNSYLEAILDVWPGLDDAKASLLLRDRGHISPRCLPEYEEAAATRRLQGRNTRLENMYSGGFWRERRNRGKTESVPDGNEVVREALNLRLEHVAEGETRPGNLRRGRRACLVLDSKDNRANFLLHGFHHLHLHPDGGSGIKVQLHCVRPTGDQRGSGRPKDSGEMLFNGGEPTGLKCKQCRPNEHCGSKHEPPQRCNEDQPMLQISQKRDRAGRCQSFRWLYARRSYQISEGCQHSFWSWPSCQVP